MDHSVNLTKICIPLTMILTKLGYKLLLPSYEAMQNFSSIDFIILEIREIKFFKFAPTRPFSKPKVHMEMLPSKCCENFLRYGL